LRSSAQKTQPSVDGPSGACRARRERCVPCFAR
jgi:hypothetical protein